MNSYLCQAVLCFRVFTLSTSPSHQIKVGDSLNDEQIEYLTSVNDLLLGNYAWERGQAEGAPNLDNPHGEESLGALIEIVKEEIEKHP